MKFLFSILLFTIPVCLNAQQINNIVLKIELASNLDVPIEVNLNLNYFDNRKSSTNRLMVTNRQIHFEKLEKEPVLADLTLIWLNKKNIKIRFLLPVDTATISINAYDKFNMAFKNQQKLYEDFYTMNWEIGKLQQASTAKIKAINFEDRDMSNVQKEIDSISEHYDRMIDNTIYKKIIAEDKHSFLAVLALIKYAERPFSHQRRKFQADSLLAEYKTFSIGMQNLPTMQYFRKLLLAEQKIESGSPFPFFKFKDTLNRTQDIGKFYGSKYTLIDFWANWCVPCREEHPNLIRQYKKYNTQGFAVISISIDKLSDTYLWKEAIKKDGIDLWPHFIDTEEQSREQLKIRFIPANFLIDDKGNIVAKYLTGEELNKVLLKLFKN